MKTHRANAMRKLGTRTMAELQRRETPPGNRGPALCDELDYLPLTGAQNGPPLATLDDAVGEQASDGG